MDDGVAGFDWDTGNRAKCHKHGVSVAEVEGLFSRPLLIVPDALHSETEERLWGLARPQAVDPSSWSSRSVNVAGNG